MESCCQLGEKLHTDENVFESDHFFVSPSTGPIGIRGYSLLLSKEHFIGMGEIPESYHKELEEVLDITRKKLSEIYKSEVVIFEHGPRIGCYRGGGCLDHAHFHIVPIPMNLIENLALNLLKGLQINDYSKIERINQFNRLSEIYEEKKGSYMFVETNDKRRFVTEVNFVIPSQYIRQLIGANLKRDDWNWRLYPGLDVFRKTIDDLTGKF